jgi:anaerobic magnesium-protoporphyrin IX monomethyl ester cyclase
MKVLLVALNAKYSHSSLALRYLKHYLEPEFPDVETLEFNINQDPGTILTELSLANPDVVGFSCYIWNIELILPLISNLRKVSPQTTIILGGPEVSFDTEHWLESYPAIDYLIAGEGEEALRRFLEEWQRINGDLGSDQLRAVPGLVYRQGINGEVATNPPEPLDLATIPPIYTGDLSELENKIVYYETTRGCPYACAYCLSSVMGRVRKFPMARSLEELRRLSQIGIEQLRFVDRTFNYDAKRAYELLEFMIALDTKTRFQLEVSGELLTPRVLELLQTAPENRFQFEIGVQSTNESTLQAVKRSADLARLREIVQFLQEKTTVRVLLDLIAGLPQEGFWRFGESFDYVYSLKPDRIHLGFLKLLRGSALRADADSFGCVYTDRAPYEVLSTDELSFREIARLKVIEDLVDKLYSPRFARSLAYLCEGRSAFGFFNELAEKWEAAGYHWLNHSLAGLYRILWELCGAGSENPDLLAWLCYDFRLHESRQMTPEWMGGRQERRLENELIQSGRIFEILPELQGLRPREIGRRIFVETLHFEQGTERLLFYFPPERTEARTFPLESVVFL